jgi:hypothetical protein
MKRQECRLGKWSLATALALCLTLAAAGCGSSFKTVPVTGKILVDGKPLTEADATIVFRPDPSKGNALSMDFSGLADEEGNYTLYYENGKPGAAPGWYKVAVVATEPLNFRTGPDDMKKGRKVIAGPPVRKTLIDRKYTLPTTSGIEIEVVEKPAPGAYDLQLTGPSRR